MYSKPTEDAAVVSQAIYGVNVAILEQRAELGAHPHARRLQRLDPAGGAPHRRTLCRRGPCGAGDQPDGAYLSRAECHAHAPLLTVPFETRLEVADESGEGRWFQVRLVDGRAGWVQGGDVAFDRKPLSTAEMLALSKRFLGLPYTWGGTSSYGYDCSGFVQMLERQRGVPMPRDAQPQAEWSGVAPVSRADLEPGDLLYFGSSEKHITHTGMYLGEGKFIDATTYQTPMVRIDDLSDPHWVRLLVAARRVK